MLKESLKFPLEEEVCDTLHYLFYITESYAEIIKDIITNKRCINSNKELLNYYNEQYLEYNLKYKAMQDEIIYSCYDLPEHSKATFHIDFMRKELVITDIIQL